MAPSCPSCELSEAIRDGSNQTNILFLLIYLFDIEQLLGHSNLKKKILTCLRQTNKGL